jgi:hypothetical protein
MKPEQSSTHLFTDDERRAYKNYVKFEDGTKFVASSITYNEHNYYDMAWADGFYFTDDCPEGTEKVLVFQPDPQATIEGARVPSTVRELIDWKEVQPAELLTVPWCRYRVVDYEEVIIGDWDLLLDRPK